ncbi:hypothetical protein ACVWW4_003778 [Bradyrhizobium sp. LB7.1]
MSQAEGVKCISLPVASETRLDPWAATQNNRSLSKSDFDGHGINDPITASTPHRCAIKTQAQSAFDCAGFTLTDDDYVGGGI